MFRRICTDCPGPSCAQCGGKGFTMIGWVEWYNRIRVERFKQAFARQNGREMTEQELRNLGID